MLIIIIQVIIVLTLLPFLYITTHAKQFINSLGFVFPRINYCDLPSRKGWKELTIQHFIIKQGKARQRPPFQDCALHASFYSSLLSCRLGANVGYITVVDVLKWHSIDER